MTQDHLELLLSDHQLYHSDYQMDYFITVKAGGTTYGQYKQALRELYKRHRGLKQLYCDMAFLGNDIEELTYKLGHPLNSPSKFKMTKWAIRRKKKMMEMEDLRRNIKDTEREFVRFYSISSVLKDKIGDLDDEKRAKLDREMWVNKILYMKEANASSANEMIDSLPKDDFDYVYSKTSTENGFNPTGNSRCLVDPLPEIPDHPLVDINGDVRKLLTGGD